MKKLFLVVIALGLTAYLALPMPGQTRSLNDKIQRNQHQVEKKRAREGVDGGRQRIRAAFGAQRAARRARGKSGDVARHARRIVRIRDGLIASDEVIRPHPNGSSQ